MQDAVFSVEEQNLFNRSKHAVRMTSWLEAKSFWILCIVSARQIPQVWPLIALPHPQLPNLKI